MKKYSLLIMLCLISVLAFSQKKENRSLSNFSYLSVGQSIDVTLVKGNEESVVLEVTGADLDDVKTEVSGDKLKIQMGKGSFRNVRVKATVTYTKLNGISVSSSASVNAKQPIKSTDFDLAVSSSGSASISVQVDELTAKVSSSGKADVSGTADDMNVKVSSSGKFLAFDLKADNATVKANSSGKAEVNVSGKLDASANSSGKIKYKGSPDKFEIDTNSSGRVSRS